MAEVFYYKSKNEFILTECKRVGENGYYYYNCIYSNGLDEIILPQSISKQIPTLISSFRMEKIVSNDKNIDTTDLTEYYK